MPVTILKKKSRELTKINDKNKVTIHRKCSYLPAVASFTKEVNPRLAKRPLKTNGRLANRGLTSLVKEATAGVCIHD